MGAMSVERRVRDEVLFEAIEWHLLRSGLTAGQARTLERHGWFDVVWRQQWLVVRVYADRFPTVDVHQLEMNATYLCSYDVRRAGGVEPLLSDPETPLGAARRVLEAYRRGMLKALLEASELRRCRGEGRQGCSGGCNQGVKDGGGVRR